VGSLPTGPTSRCSGHVQFLTNGPEIDRVDPESGGRADGDGSHHWYANVFVVVAPVYVFVLTHSALLSTYALNEVGGLRVAYYIIAVVGIVIIIYLLLHINSAI
jgi:hypothetical protein